MAIRFQRMVHAKEILHRSLFAKNHLHNKIKSDIPKGHLAVYLGKTEKKRYVVPISYLNQPSFQNLLSHAEEEFGFNHPIGGLTIPCKEDVFIDVTSAMDGSL